MPDRTGSAVTVTPAPSVTGSSPVTDTLSAIDWPVSGTAVSGTAVSGTAVSGTAVSGTAVSGSLSLTTGRLTTGP